MTLDSKTMMTPARMLLMERQQMHTVPTVTFLHSSSTTHRHLPEAVAARNAKKKEKETYWEGLPPDFPESLAKIAVSQFFWLLWYHTCWFKERHGCHNNETMRPMYSSWNIEEELRCKPRYLCLRVNRNCTGNPTAYRHICMRKRPVCVRHAYFRILVLKLSIAQWHANHGISKSVMLRVYEPRYEFLSLIVYSYNLPVIAERVFK